MQELRGAVAVARHRCPERDLTEVLQHIVEGEEPRVSGLPHAITRGKRVGRKRAESQEVVAAEHDHVDREVVSREHTEVRPYVIAKREPSPLGRTLERRVLCADARLDLE